MVGLTSYIYLTLSIYLTSKAQENLYKSATLFQIFCLSWENKYFVAILENAEVRIRVIKFLEFCCIYLQKRSLSLNFCTIQVSEISKGIFRYSSPSIAILSQVRQLLFIELILRNRCTSSLSQSKVIQYYCLQCICSNLCSNLSSNLCSNLF